MISPSLRGRPFIEARTRHPRRSRAVPARRPFGDGPSSRRLRGGRNACDGRPSPSLRGRPFIEARAGAPSRRHWGTRRPFGDGPSSRPPRQALRVVERTSSPSLRGRPFIEAAAGAAQPSGSGFSPSLRGRPFIEACLAPCSRSPSGLAVPSGTALHRGAMESRRSLMTFSSPSLRGRPFIEARVRCATSVQIYPTRRPFGDGPSSRLATAGGHVGRPLLAVPSGTALHRGCTCRRSAMSFLSSPSLRGRPFIEVP